MRVRVSGRVLHNYIILINMKIMLLECPEVFITVGRLADARWLMWFC